MFVSKSTDNGASWSSASSGIDEAEILALAVDPQNSSIVYAGSTRRGAYKSVNGGATWSKINAGLANLTVNALVIDPANSSRLYAGTRDGVFVSTNAGSSWSALSEGLANRRVLSLAVSPSGQCVYAGTMGGAYQLEVESGGTDCASPLVSAVLPGSRAVQVGTTATAFASMIFTGAGTATGCAIGLTNAPSGAELFYQQTNAANEPIGQPNTPISIPAGQVGTLVFGVTPRQAFAATELRFNFDCGNTTPAAEVPGVNTLLLTSSNSPTPDIVALAAAPGGQGIVTIPGTTGTGFFAVATVNVGAGALITATADTGTVVLPVTLSLCQSNPTTGVCINPTTPTSRVNVQINANETPTVAIFAQGSGNIAFSPGVNRINVKFKTQAGGTVGSTSVAVFTGP